MLWQECILGKHCINSHLPLLSTLNVLRLDTACLDVREIRRNCNALAFIVVIAAGSSTSPVSERLVSLPTTPPKKTRGYDTPPSTTKTIRTRMDLFRFSTPSGE